MRISVVENNNLIDGSLWNSRSDGGGAGLAVYGKRPEENFVKDAVVSTGKHGNFVATGDGSSDSGGSKNGFRSGVGECHARHTRHFADHLGNFADNRLDGANFKTGVKLLAHCFNYEFRTMAEHAGAETHYKVDVFVAIHVPNLAAVRTSGVDGINHLFPQAVEARCGTRISNHRAILCGKFFRLCRAFAVAFDERVEGLCLFRRGRQAGVAVKRLKGSVG